MKGTSDRSIENWNCVMRCLPANIPLQSVKQTRQRGSILPQIITIDAATLRDESRRFGSGDRSGFCIF
jgi:hypothetical protein